MLLAQTTGDAIQGGVALVAFAAAAKGVLGFLKSLRAREWNAVYTTLVWWGAGIALVYLFTATRWADGLEIFGLKLSQANTGELCVLGSFGVGTLGIAWQQNEKAKDASQSAAQPPLFSASPGQGSPGELPTLPGLTGETIDPEVAEAAGSFTPTTP